MTLDPNVLIALSLLIARQEPPSKVTPKFANPGGAWDYADAHRFASAWWQADREGCDRECRIAIDAHWCSVCGLPQFLTPSGLTCDNGHGDAPSLTSLPRKHEWADNPKDPAGYVCDVCGAGDLDERAKYPCQ